MKIWNFSAWALQLLSSFPTIAATFFFPNHRHPCSSLLMLVVWWEGGDQWKLLLLVKLSSDQTSERQFPRLTTTAAPWPGDWTDADQDNKRNKRSVARGRCTQHTHLKQLFYIQSTLAPIIRIQEWDWDVVKFSSLDHLGYKDGTVDSLMWRYHHLLILVVEFNLLLLLEFSFI